MASGTPLTASPSPFAWGGKTREIIAKVHELVKETSVPSSNTGVNSQGTQGT